MIAYTCDTADPAEGSGEPAMVVGDLPEGRGDAGPPREAAGGARVHASPGSRSRLRGFRTDIEIFREENVPLFSELETLVAAYQKITGGLTVDWNGETEDGAAAAAVPQGPRSHRSREGVPPWREGVPGPARRDGDAVRPDVREAAAGRAERRLSATTRRTRSQSKHRFDYTPDDCARFHRAVETTVAAGRRAPDGAPARAT